MRRGACEKRPALVDLAVVIEQGIVDHCRLLHLRRMRCGAGKIGRRDACTLVARCQEAREWSSDHGEVEGLPGLAVGAAACDSGGGAAGTLSKQAQSGCELPKLSVESGKALFAQSPPAAERTRLLSVGVKRCIGPHRNRIHQGIASSQNVDEIPSLCQEMRSSPNPRHRWIRPAAERQPKARSTPRSSFTAN